MEIGSFIELELPKGREYYKGDKNIARLNSGRAGIYHAFRITGCRAIWLPYYQCDSVREFLLRKNIVIRYYHIDERFEPIGLRPALDEAVLLVNYFGIMSCERMSRIVHQFTHVIIDNSQAFFSRPIPGCLCVYSTRKFMGVPDGAYVIGESADGLLNEYEQGYSSDTSLFLLQRIEYGCEGKAYQSREANEDRINSEDIKRMSMLTRAILDGTDYDIIQQKRQENYRLACRLFGEINQIQPEQFSDRECVPMVYPLMVEDDGLLKRLLEAKHFQGHWWSYLLDEMMTGSFEYWISLYVIPITIDQRYGEEELTTVRRITV